ncbi:MAG: hypothetical protein EAX96_05315 [Candidatus Lokiarchaeota archaeon]|nr:hypothetical protein [Candidatus Lokiarchaeota archaeon]
MSQVSSYYDVKDDGELIETPVSGLLKDILTPEMVVLVVNDITKKIWLWKGSNAKVRKKFIAARKSQDLRGEKGLSYKVESIDHGDEPDEFIQMIGGPVAASAPEVIEELNSFVQDQPASTKPPKPVQPAQLAPSFQPAYSPPPPNNEPAPFHPPAPVQPSSFIEIPKPIQPTIPSPEKPSVQESIPQQTVTSSDINASIQSLNVEESVKKILVRIQALQVPAAFQRELICIGPYVFSQIESKKSFLGKETVEYKFELMSDLPEGEFLANNYIPRLLINEGRVMGIELLKTGEDISPGTQLEAFKIRFQK